MTSALTRRSWRELTHRRARATLTIATLSAAVAGLWLFATPSLVDSAINDRVATDRAHEVLLKPGGVLVDDAGLARLRSLPNVAGLDGRATFWTDLAIGERVRRAWVVGVHDFDDQQVNVVSVTAGTAPTTGSGVPIEALTEAQNERTGSLRTGIGDTLQVRAADGSWRPLIVTGRGQTLEFGSTVAGGDPVLYVPSGAVNELAGFAGFTRVEATLVDHDPEAVAATVGALRSELSAIEPSVFYNDIAELRSPDEWPGKEDFDRFVSLFWVIAGVSLLSAFVLVATTMTTLVRDQHREIGIMKAVGGRGRTVARSFLMTALLLGGIATLIGVAVGAVLANLLVDFLGGRFFGVDPGWEISPLALGLSLAVGLGLTVLASLPALWRAARIPVRQALESAGIEARYGTARIDRIIASARFLPRPARLGLRNAARRKGRSLSTGALIAFAVGTVVAFGAVSITLAAISEETQKLEGGDITVYGVTSSGDRAPFDARAQEVLRNVEGVAAAQPFTLSHVAADGVDTWTWGLPADTIYDHELIRGRWFDAREEASRARVAVIGKALVTQTGLDVGDTVTVEDRSGLVRYEVIGIDNHMVNDGKGLFVPVSTLLEVNRYVDPSTFWVTGTANDTASIEELNGRILSALSSEGYSVGTSLRHVQRAAEREEARMIVAVIMTLGLPLVVVGMIGLVGALTTNVLERRREIAILRSLGAQNRQLRRIFRAEGLALAFLGWLGGIAVGYVLGRVVIHFIGNAFHTSFELRFPLWPLAVALLTTVIAALLVLHFPLRRACRLQPGEGLRYE
jgi:putative ABC transport system permease protein